MQNPLEIIPSNDTGADVYQRYRYQAKLAVPYCVACALNKDVLSVVPEHIEDLAIEYNWGWLFIQVKTRDLCLGPWKLTDVLRKPSGGLRGLFRTYKLLKSINNIKLELHIEGAVKRNDFLEELLTQNKQHSDLIIAKVALKLELNEMEAASFLSLVQVLEREPRNVIKQHNKAKILEISPTLTGAEADQIQEKIIQEVSRSMELERVGTGWPKFVCTPLLPSHIELEKVSAKRITADKLKHITELLTGKSTKHLQHTTKSIEKETKETEKRIFLITEQYKQLYFKYGNAQDFNLLTDVAIAEAEKHTISNTSFQLARLLKYIAFTHINTGQTENILKARSLLQKAVTIIENINFYSKESNLMFAKTRWLLSITYCLTGDINKAISICEKSLPEIDKFYNSNIGKLIINREMFLLTKSEDYKKIIESDNLTNNEFQIFQTKRRIFEYHLRKNDAKMADKIFPPVNLLFNKLKHQLDKIYIATYYKDLYIYFRIKSDLNIANIYFKKASNNFQKYGLQGQEIILQQLKKTYDN